MDNKKNDKNFALIKNLDDGVYAIGHYITIRPIDKKDRDNIIKMQNELAEIVRKYSGILSVKDGDVELGWF